MQQLKLILRRSEKEEAIALLRSLRKRDKVLLKLALEKLEKETPAPEILKILKENL